MRSALLVAALLAAASAPAAPVRLLLAIGNNVGLPGETRLVHAPADARRVADVFSALGEVTSARVMADEPVGAVERGLMALRELAARGRSEDTTVIVYFSGHGDEGNVHLAGERLPLQRLKALVDAIPARLRLIILDSCRSASGRAKGLVDDTPFAVSLEGPAGPSGVVLVRSSSSGEVAQESDALGGAVFTHFFVSALRGAADRDGDKRVSFDEAYAYAFSQTLRKSAATRAGVQHPEADVDLAGAGALVLTRTARAVATLALPLGADLQYIVYVAPSGTMVAEAWGAASRSVELALPAGRYVLQRRGQGRFGAAEVSLLYGGRRALSEGDFEEMSLEVLATKGGALFERPHELLAGYGLAFGGRTELGHRLTLGYGYRAAALAVTAALDLGLTDHVDDAYDVQERWIGGSVRVEWRLPVGPVVDFALGGGGTVRWIDQTLVRQDAGRLEQGGYESERQYGALAGGLTVLAAVRFALSDRVALDVSAVFDGLLARRGEAPAFLFAGSVEAGLVVSF